MHQSSPKKIVDIHVHMHPPRLFAAIRRWFSEKSDWHLQHPTTPASICSTLKEHNVERFAFCSYAHKPDMASALNDWLIKTAEEIDFYGLPLATIHPEDLDCVAYLERAFKKGCIGVKIHEDVQRFGIDDRRLKKVYDVVAHFGGFILAHIGPIPWNNEFLQAPDRVATVFAENLHVNFVLAHLGAPDTVNYLKLTKEHPNLYLDTAMAFALAESTNNPIDAQMLQTYSNRIIFGTDYPNIPYAYDFELQRLTEIFDDENKHQQIVYDNAARLMKIN